ncbi:protein phosphatase 2C domain-containing protein [Deinococcus sp.]|uniref:protein phosphatase 2C domain-containing protein n=1 Tax=Deinococcus sp. TaxID=47478 RepID=UPI0028699365|nr:protein phosphatase 2C domain-containing protein [Deinococcus sp.]
MPAPSGFSDDLEEEVFAPTAPTSGPVVGDVLDGYHLNEDLGRGWFIASPVASGPSVEVYARPEPQWSTLAAHRALPRFSRVGALHVLAPVGGEAMKVPAAPGAALAHLRELSQLLFALEKQGKAVVDLDPDSPRVTPDGVRLRFPPRVVPLGDATGVAVREGFTPPEVLAGRSVDARSGVYVLGALLYHWLTGGTLPPEGATGPVLGGVMLPGVPQLLRGMLAPVDERLTPAEVLAALNTLTLPALPAYQVAAATTVGLNPERPMNEDSYGFTWRQLGVHGASVLVLRAVVSDGMGGMAAGEVASAAAVQAFLDSRGATLPEMVWDANAAVLAAMAGRDGGCTFSGVEVRGPHLQLGHVGDTRAYVRQGGKVRQLSRDHSYVAAMVASGQMTPEQALTSPERNKVLRSLGSLRVPQENYVQTLDQPLELGVGDRVLLVSDGVWGEVPDEVLAPLLDTLPLQPLVDRLIALALEAGAPDNATALVIERVE